ncbi:type II toxin-antitoxin system VapB family antitoxin [Aphanothece sacrum]|uniref:Superoxide dismutase n=1 Tax=Aphanothece sacrum FPU1 TaxID=1920663 RepID=A0A401IGY6_APHSA|nr:DUF2281 domain-containing protein [Aphanothece sacrum]GBF80460.1 superoxide dismutase [Aphanothece sacrum FPU1]GBF85541.1 superoxide dismutase [Aphanothece sacrum FPU3]
MVVKNEIIANLDKLPEALQIEILHYSEYLISRYLQQNQEQKSTKRGCLGILKGKIVMSDDFDEPLEEMKE